jgi:pilus assembly protein CpaD
MTKEKGMLQMKTIFRGCAALMTVLVAACAYPVNGPDSAPPVEKRFPITVEPRMQTLRVGVDSGGLDPASMADLQRFARDYLRNGSGLVRVSAPRRIPQAANTVAAQMADFGVPRNRIVTGVDDVATPADEVRVSYVGYVASAEPCGDWSSNVGYTAANAPTPNFGCATQHNLAAMVADPRDLVTPKPLGPEDAQRRLTILDKYRKGESTVATKAAEQSGVVSSAVPSGGGTGGGK